MQAKLHRPAAADPGRRFDDLFNLVHDSATLIVAFDRVAGNRGAKTPGVDGRTVADVGDEVPRFLNDLRASLKDGSFRPLPVRERIIPKPGGSGKARRLFDTDGGRPGGSGRAQVGAGTDLRGRLRAGLVRVPAQPAGAGRDRRDPLLRHPRLPMGAGCGHRGALRSDRARRIDGSCPVADQGQAGPGAGQGVPQGRGSHRTRRSKGHHDRHAPGWHPVAVVGPTSRPVCSTST